MSTFRRTISGLNNQHLFHNVDFVVFLEGGKTSFNKEQAYEGNYSSETEDIIFWKNLFKVFQNHKKIKFKSIGSKSTVSEIAMDIIDGQLSTVYVAMDIEFDEILNRRLKHPNIYYTHGYSWENDVWSHDTIKVVIEELSAIEIENNEIEVNFNEFIKKIKIAVYADAYLFKSGSSFFPRKQGRMFCVDCNPIDLPKIKELEIKNKITEKGITQRKAMRYGNKFCLDIKRFCFGHFLADYCCQVILLYLRKRHSLTNVSKDIIHRMGIKKHFELSFENGQTYLYYKNQLDPQE